MEQIGLKAVMDMAGFSNAMKAYNQSVNDASGNTEHKAGIMGKAFSALGTVAKIGFAGVVGALGTFTGLVASSIGPASDLAETINKVGVIFGESADTILAFSETTAKTLGQSKQQALDAAATFATFGKSAGLTGDELSTFAIQFTGLASDLASFNNTSPEEAIQAIGAALRGESEPLRRYGVLLDDASMREEALRLGLIKTTTEALTPQQKVLAAQALIMKQTSDAQGDFARTSDGLANSQRIVKAQVANFRAELGTAFLPIVQKVFGILADLGQKVFPIITQVGIAISGLIEGLMGGDVGGAFDALAEGLDGFLSPQLSRALYDFGSALEDIFNWLGTNIPLAFGIVKDFIVSNVLPVIRDLGAWFGEMLPRAINYLVGIFNESIIPAFNDYVGVVKTQIIPTFKVLWSEIQEHVIPRLQDLAEWFLANLPVAIKFVSDVFKQVFIPIVTAVWTFIRENLIPIVMDIIDWMAEELPPAIQKAADWFETHILPVLKNVWDFIKTQLIPAIGEIVDWLVENIPPAIQTAISWFEEHMVPALKAVWAFIQDPLLPILGDIITWLAHTIATTIFTFSTVVWPKLVTAFTTVKDFIVEELWPKFTDVATWLGTTIGTIIETFKTVWGGLKTAFKTVSDFIDTNLTGTSGMFTKIKNWLGDVVGPISTFATGAAETLKSAFQGIYNVLKPLYDIVKWIIENIGKAIGSLTSFTGAVGSWVESALGDIESPGGGRPSGPSGPRKMPDIQGIGGGGTMIANNNTVNVYLNANISNGMDLEAFRVFVLDTVSGAMAA